MAESPSTTTKSISNILLGRVHDERSDELRALCKTGGGWVEGGAFSGVADAGLTTPGEINKMLKHVAVDDTNTCAIRK